MGIAKRFLRDFRLDRRANQSYSDETLGEREVPMGVGPCSLRRHFLSTARDEGVRLPVGSIAAPGGRRLRPGSTWLDLGEDFVHLAHTMVWTSLIDTPWSDS